MARDLRIQFAGATYQVHSRGNERRPKETYLAELLRYVILNPVRAKMVATPEAYRWSSFRATADLCDAPEWLDVQSALEPFGEGATAREKYRQFVMAKVGDTTSLWDQVTNAIYLGTADWVTKMRRIVESKPRSTDHPKRQCAVGRPAMPDVIKTVARGANRQRLEVRSRAGGSLRRLAAWLGWYEGWLTLRTIAASLRLRSEGYVSNLIRRCDRELAIDAGLREQLDLALAALRLDASSPLPTTNLTFGALRRYE